MSRRVWRGRAVQIEMEDVLLSLDKRFVAGYVRGEKVEICFVLSRTPLRIFHQGLEAAAQISPLMLFPPATLPEVPLRPPRGGPEGAFINKIIKKVISVNSLINLLISNFDAEQGNV